MALILAIEPDRRQAAQLSNVIRSRVSAELVLAESTERALAAIGDRVPDLVLIPALLSPQDDAALAGALRAIAAAARVQMLTIPVLADVVKPPKPRGMLAQFRRSRAGSPVPDGCDPAVFGDQIAAYLAEISAEREGGQLCEPAPTGLDNTCVIPAMEKAESEAIAEIAEVAAIAAIVTTVAILEVAEIPEVTAVATTVEIPETVEPWHATELAAPAAPTVEAIGPPVAALAVAPILVEAVVEQASDRLTGSIDHPAPRPVDKPITVVIDEPAASQIDEPTVYELCLDDLAGDVASMVAINAALSPIGVPDKPQPRPLKRSERSEWTELIESLRLDLARRGTEWPAHEPSARREEPAIVAPTPVAAKRRIGPLPQSSQKQRRAKPLPAPSRQPGPIQDEWGLFDPEQCGFAALLAKLEEITDPQEEDRVVAQHVSCSAAEA